jgi:hypothetical protein
MKGNYISIAVLALVLLNGCGSSVRIFTDIEESAKFDSYTTYNFLDFTEGNKKTITGMELERIRVAFARELERRGLRFVEEGADVSVQITVYHREAADHYYFHPAAYHHMQRAISVDMYDNSNRRHVWHAAAVGELEYDAKRRSERLPELVAEIFERYPVPRANKS